MGSVVWINRKKEDEIYPFIPPLNPIWININTNGRLLYKFRFAMGHGKITHRCRSRLFSRMSAFYYPNICIAFLNQSSRNGSEYSFLCLFFALTNKYKLFLD